MSSTVQNKSKKSSAKARSSAARLAAAQAVYQAQSLNKKPTELIEEYISYRLGTSVDGEEMVEPDGMLFSFILENVEKSLDELQSMVEKAMGNKNQEEGAKTSKPEALLQSILLCGAAELLANKDIDAPIIISDYLHVTHAFYEQGEAKLVNAVLDNLKVVLRETP